MKKSKEMKVERWDGTFDRYVRIRFLNNTIAAEDICYGAFTKYFGVKLKDGETKRIRITIEEVK